GLVLPGALNREYRLRINESGKKSAESEMTRWAGLNDFSKGHQPFLEGFNYKKPTEAHALDSLNRKQLDYSDIFQVYDKVGITKSEGGEPERKGFFKQQSLSFKDNSYAFVVYVVMDEVEGDQLKAFVDANPQVPMGGERYSFHMELTKEKIDPKCFEVYLAHSDLDSGRRQLILLSPTKVQANIYNYCDFAIATTINFRHFIRGNTTKYSNRPVKSDGYLLMAKGSVLYPSPQGYRNLVAELTTKTKGFRQIGYNSFVEVNAGQISPNLYPSEDEGQNV
ncbi:MAG: hypothetical protein KDC44_11205, partial [Phaeodactylibacter sp.]|nr:hypothetical protein [Phaeodactylibacter sp.]